MSAEVSTKAGQPSTYPVRSMAKIRRRFRRRWKNAAQWHAQMSHPSGNRMDLSKIVWKVKKKNAFLTRELIKAVNADDAAPVSRLVAAGADIEVKSKGKNTLLFHCIQSRLENTAAALIDAGADVNVKDGDGISLLATALDFASDKTLVRLIEAGADFGPSKVLSVAQLRARYMNRPYLSRNPVEIIAAEGRSDVIKAVLNRGYKPDSRYKDQSTALIVAAKSLTLDTCGETKEIEKEIRDDHGFIIKSIHTSITVFDHEIKENYLETVRALLAAGANSDLTDKSGKTAADYAEDFDMKELLTKKQKEKLCGNY